MTGKGRRRPSGTAAIACLALLLALGGTVYAAGKSHKLSGGKIKKSSIAGNRFKKETIAGKQINESTLGPVPAAETGETLEGERRFNVRIGFGQTQTLLTAGPFTFTAVCLQNTESAFSSPNRDVARILISTSANGAVFDGLRAKRGTEPGDFLETTTAEPERIFEEVSADTGTTYIEADESEESAAYSDSGTAVSFDAGGTTLGVNVGGPGCLFFGNAMVETR